MRKIMVLPVFVLVGVIGIVLSIRIINSQEHSNKVQTSAQQSQAVSDPPGTIDGAANPELIPDNAAYSLMFRLIANRQSDKERKTVKEYLRQAGLGRRNCKNCPQSNSDDSDIEAVIIAAEEVHARASVLDERAAKIKDSNNLHLSQQAKEELKILQHQNDQIVTEVVAALPFKLSSDGLQILRQHVKEHVKRRVKIIPGPMMPSNNMTSH